MLYALCESACSKPLNNLTYLRPREKRRRKMSRLRSVFGVAAGLTLMLFVAGLAWAGDKKSFREGREEFRKKIETKQEKPIEGDQGSPGGLFSGGCREI